MRLLFISSLFGTALILSAVSMPFVIRMARKLNIVDNPGARKVHRTAHPLLGGVAIFSAFFITVIGSLIAARIAFSASILPVGTERLLERIPAVLPKLTLLLSGGLAMHLLGLLDDIFKERIPYYVKFIGQIAIAAVVAAGGIRTEFMPAEWLDLLITVFWIVGISNSFNLLDNLDGLTAGVSVISAVLLIVIAYMQGQVFFAFILAALAGSAFGFLLYNYHPSKLFMGDSGSLFLGFMFAVTTVMGSYVVETSVSLLPVAIPVLVLSVPLYDTFSVMFIRWREGRPLFLGDKRHFSHRLLDIGLTHRQAVNFIYLVSFGVGLSSLLLPYVSFAGSIVVLVQALVIYGLLTVLISAGRRLNLNNQSS